MKGTMKVSKGIVYFSSDFDALRFGKEHCDNFPQWRIVSYQLGWAVQTIAGGDYLGKNGLPSEQSKVAQREAARAKRWKKTGVSESTVKWMRENGML